MNILSDSGKDTVVDIMLKGRGYHPPTHGEGRRTSKGEFVATETVFTSPGSQSSNSAYDYIFEFRKGEELAAKDVSLAYPETQVEKFQVQGYAF